jgi:DNA polymerase/3'-5' exonuclease PolX
MMARDVRRQIVREFLKTGHVPNATDFARATGMDIEDLRRELKEAAPLADLSGLSPEQARQLINEYGDGIFFEPSIEKSLKQFETTRKEIEKKEKGLK